MTAAAATEYLIWRSANAVRIETADGAVTLSNAAAAGLRAELLPPPKREYHRWTNNELAQLAALYKEGASVRQIAQTMGVTFRSATARINSLGIANRKPAVQARGRSRRGINRRVA